MPFKGFNLKTKMIKIRNFINLGLFQIPGKRKDDELYILAWDYVLAGIYSIVGEVIGI